MCQLAKQRELQRTDARRDQHASPSGGAGVLAVRRGHPRGLGQDGVVPRRHVSQRGAAAPTEGSAESVDVEFDPGKCPVPFPKAPRRPRGSTPPRGEGHRRGHLSRPGCRPAPQSLHLAAAVVVIGTGSGVGEGWWPRGWWRIFYLAQKRICNAITIEVTSASFGAAGRNRRWTHFALGRDCVTAFRRACTTMNQKDKVWLNADMKTTVADFMNWIV